MKTIFRKIVGERNIAVFHNLQGDTMWRVNGQSIWLTQSERNDLVKALLELPPIDALNGGKPLILYFRNEKDRQEMIDAIKEAKPGMVTVELPS